MSESNLPKSNEAGLGFVFLDDIKTQWRQKIYIEIFDQLRTTFFETSKL